MTKRWLKIYIEQLYSLIDELELKKEETDKTKTIIQSAGNKYLDLTDKENQTTIKFTLNGYYE